MPYYVCKGAKLKCSMGSEQSDLEVVHPTKPFGQCSSLANPTIAAAVGEGGIIDKNMLEGMRGKKTISLRMKLLLGLISLFFICCDAEKIQKKGLYLCRAGIDSLLQHSLQSSNKIKDELFGKYADDFALGEFMGEGYVDGHCLDSGKSLMLYQDEWYQVLEYGNFNKSYYIIDSVVLPLFDFKAFKTRQQVVWQDLNWNSDDSYIDYLRNSLRYASLTSIYPYKNKIFGIKSGYGYVIVMDIQKKSYEKLVHYNLSEPDSYERLSHLPYWKKHEGSLANLNLIGMKNDTIVLSRIKSKNGFMDTLMITLDGENFVPNISDSLCLRIKLKSGKEKRVGDKDRCGY